MIDNSPDLGDDISKFAALSFVLVAAFLYTIGWSYVYGYFTAFGLSARTPGLELYDILIESLRVLQINKWLPVLVVATILAARYARRFVWLHWLTSAPQSVRLLLMAIVVLISLPWVFSVCSEEGRDDAKRHMMENSSALPQVVLEFDKDKHPVGLFDPDEIQNGVVDAGYRMITSSKESHFIVRPIKGSSVKNPTNLVVVEIPRSMVRGIRYLAPQR